MAGWQREKLVLRMHLRKLLERRGYNQQMSISIWWVRRDLRLDDNPALRAALDAGGGTVLPVFLLDPFLLARDAPLRQAFLWDGLRQLDADLRLRGSRLLVRKGAPAAELARLVAETGAESIHAAEDYSPYARRRDDRIASTLPLQLHGGLTVHHPLALRKTDGRPYTVFTPFSKAWKALPFSYTPWRCPERMPDPPELPGEPIPASAGVPAFPAGEQEALRRLEYFLAGPGAEYTEGRNRLDLDGTSALSPYLRFGMLSPRRAAARAMEALQTAGHVESRKGYETWLNELIWREFYNAILYEFPSVLKEAFNPSLRAVPWRDAPADLAAWQQGLTGFPVVDAAMRQLAATGWMHNRARMIVASFLVKDLLIDWRAGEAHFMRLLLDGDPAANNGGWQWTAGVGTDAAPYFRIFNPLLQSRKFDPRGDYIRRWVPELANVPVEFIHAPAAMPLDHQIRIGVQIGSDYPAPIVDHASARTRTLAAFKASSGSSRKADSGQRKRKKANKFPSRLLAARARGADER